jgi:hypothetical protein
MIECLPAGICSWDYLLRGDGHDAQVEFNGIGEQGRLLVDREPFRIEKDGMFSGSWRMVSEHGTLFAARKPSALSRSFEISGAGIHATLHAASAFGRTMILEGGGRQLLIAPAHPFTRRASITGTCDDFRLAAFAFWLTGLLWRRAANSSGGGGGAS